MGSDTKEKILEAALELFAELGYKGASVRKIASKVGIRESALYNHFKNKEEIFNEIINRIFISPFDEFFQKRPVEEYAPKGKQYLREYAMVIKLLTFDKKNEKLFKIVLQELLHNGKIRELFLRQFYIDSIKKLSKAFYIMMDEELIKSADPKMMAKEFLAPLFYFRIQVVLYKIDGKDLRELSTLFEKHVDFFWDMISIPS